MVFPCGEALSGSFLIVGDNDHSAPLKSSTPHPSAYGVHLLLEGEGFWIRALHGFSPFRVEKLAAKQTDEGVFLLRAAGVVSPYRTHL